MADHTGIALHNLKIINLIYLCVMASIFDAPLINVVCNDIVNA